jgi:glycine cleavage system regulatory protein
MDVEEEEVQSREIHNIFNKIITQTFPNLEKVLPIQVQEASRTPNRHDQRRTSPKHIIIKTSTENRERLLEAVREKRQIIYKDKSIKITDFSMETLKAGKTCSEVFQIQIKIT